MSDTTETPKHEPKVEWDMTPKGGDIEAIKNTATWALGNDPEIYQRTIIIDYASHLKIVTGLRQQLRTVNRHLRDANRGAERATRELYRTQEMLAALQAAQPPTPPKEAN